MTPTITIPPQSAPFMVTALAMAQRYGYPIVPAGTTYKSIALIELAGGYYQADIAQACAGFNLPVPPVTVRGGA